MAYRYRLRCTCVACPVPRGGVSRRVAVHHWHIHAEGAWRSAGVPFIADLRHPDQGFALGYIPVIPMLLVAQAAPRTAAFRILDLVLVALWATATAALVAHWITTPAGPGRFIACISLQVNGCHALAIGLIGGFFWIIFGTVIVGRLMTEQPLTDARFPTLVTLMVPPATASVPSVSDVPRRCVAT